MIAVLHVESYLYVGTIKPKCRFMTALIINGRF